MRGKIFLFLVLSCVALFITVTYPMPAQAAEAIKLRLSCALPPRSFQNAELLPAFAKEIKEKTGGKVIVEIYPGGQLYGHEETAEAVQRGAIEMGFNSINHWVGFDPIFCWNDYPFLVPDLKYFLQRESRILPFMEKSLQKINVKLLSFAPYSGTCIATKTAVLKPEDARGLRIRGVSDPFFDAIKAWGGVPAAVSASEMYDALAKGALDGVMTGWESVEKRKLFEVTKYVAGPTAASIWGIFINIRTWNRLPQDVKEIIETASKNVYKRGFQEQQQIDEKSIVFLKNHGVNVKIFTPEENAAWKRATKPAYDIYVKRCSDKGSGEAAKAILEVFQ